MDKESIPHSAKRPSYDINGLAFSARMEINKHIHLKQKEATDRDKATPGVVERQKFEIGEIATLVKTEDRDIDNDVIEVPLSMMSNNFVYIKCLSQN